MRMQHRKWSVITVVSSLLIMTISCASLAGAPALAPTQTPGPPTATTLSVLAVTPSAACDPATVKELEQAVSHEWAAQGATQVALIALNEAFFTCYFGARASLCDIAGLSALQLTLSQDEASGQTPPVDTQIAYANTLAVCLGQKPPDNTSTPAAPGPAPSAADCDTLYADWVLSGEPDLSTNAQLSAFYAALLKCYAVQSVVSKCDLTALAQLHLGLRATAALTITSGMLQGYEPLVLGCFGSNPVLLAGFGAVAAGHGGGKGGPGPNIPPVIPPPNTTPNATPQPTQETSTASGPYVVKQVVSLGGEVISGNVCSLGLPFSVNAATPKVAWVFNFLPQSDVNGKVTYSYSIPSAGESHDAAGTYTIGQPNADGVVRLSLVVSDHVVFHGFDGKIPVKYYFDLVPTATVRGCPAP